MFYTILTLKITTAQVVEMPVTVNNNNFMRTIILNLLIRYSLPNIIIIPLHNTLFIVSWLMYRSWELINFMIQSSKILLTL